MKYDVKKNQKMVKIFTNLFLRLKICYFCKPIVK